MHPRKRSSRWSEYGHAEGCGRAVTRWGARALGGAVLALWAGLAGQRASAQEVFAPGAAPTEDAPRTAPAEITAPASDVQRDRVPPQTEGEPVRVDPGASPSGPAAGGVVSPGAVPIVDGAPAAEGVPAPEGAPTADKEVPANQGGAADADDAPADNEVPAAQGGTIDEAAPVAADVSPSDDMPPPGQATAVDLAAPEATLAEYGELDDPVVLNGTISVDVDDGSLVSIVGDTQSLRAVVEEICRQAGIDLRAYGAPDRRYAGRLEDVPLTDALRSMLKSESYLLGFQDHGSEPRVTWLRVLSASGDAAAAAGAAPAQPVSVPTPPPPSPSSRKFVISSSLLYQAFGTFDPARRDQAQREVLARIDDPEQLERFLSSDPKDLANMFGRYRNSDQTVRRLKSMAENADVQAKLDAVLSEMGASEEDTGEDESVE